MRNTLYRRFFDELKPVMNFAVDGVLTADPSARPNFFSRQAFLEDLYVHRSVEKKLHRYLQSSPDLVCFVGDSGAGKSSVAHQVLDDLERASAPRPFVVYIDVRVDDTLRAVKSKKGSAFDAALSQRLVTAYLHRLFPQTAPAKDSKRLDLWAYLLSAFDEVTHSEALFAQYGDLIDDAESLRSICAEQLGADISLREWLRATYSADQQTRTITAAVRRLLSLPHLVHAARQLCALTRQILWLDNIDALPLGLQPRAVSLLKYYHSQARAYIATIVAVRDENVFRAEDLSDYAAPPHVSLILVAKADERQPDGRYHPAIDLPLIHLDTFRSIVDRRLKAAQRLSGLPLADYALVQQMSDELIGIYRATRAVYLANNSVRDLMGSHRSCLMDLIDKRISDAAAPSDAPFPEWPDWYLTTLYLSWIRSSTKLWFGVYDIVALTEDWYGRGRQGTGCFLPYLIVTTIWNLSLERRAPSGGKRRYRSPTVREVVERLALLEYSRDDVVKSMVDLAYQDEHRQNAIDFRADRAVTLPRHVRDDHVVYVTLRGKALIGIVCNSFGYFFECIRHHEFDEGDPRLDELPRISPTSEAADSMMPYLCDVAQMHYCTLKRIRNSKRLGSVGWLQQYYACFGLPQRIPYRMGIGTGRKVRGYKRALQFEALIHGLQSYVRHGAAGAKLQKLGQLYEGALSGLAAVGDAVDETEPDFRGMMELPPRS